MCIYVSWHPWRLIVFGRNFIILAGGFLQSGAKVKETSAQTQKEVRKSMPVEFCYENRIGNLINNGIVMSHGKVQAVEVRK